MRKTFEALDGIDHLLFVVRVFVVRLLVVVVVDRLNIVPIVSGTERLEVMCQQSVKTFFEQWIVARVLQCLSWLLLLWLLIWLHGLRVFLPSLRDDAADSACRFESQVLLVSTFMCGLELVVIVGKHLPEFWAFAARSIKLATMPAALEGWIRSRET